MKFQHSIYLVSIFLLTACEGCSDLSKVKPRINQKSNNPTIQNPVIKNDDPAYANILNASTVRVIDGDTIEVILDDAPSERIRFMGIDTPESNQPFGSKSTANLQECVDVGNVTVSWDKKDRYDRIVGKVIADGIDCNLKQVTDGYAWHYKQYQSEQSEADRISYANAEKVAQGKNKGLWSSDCIIAPWDWRKSIRTCDSVSESVDSTIPTKPVIPTQCDGISFKTCSQMVDCNEALRQLKCGNDRLDGDNDGMPCENICRQNTLNSKIFNSIHGYEDS